MICVLLFLLLVSVCLFLLRASVLCVCLVCLVCLVLSVLSVCLSSCSVSDQLSKHKEAIAESSRALSDDPTYTKAYERRASSLFELGECRTHALPP